MTLCVGEYELEHPVLLNGGGMIKTIEDLERMLPAADVPVVGSATAPKRPGSSGDTYYIDPVSGASINSLNMPNGGTPYFETALPEMVLLAHEQGKPLVFNAAGFSVEDYVVLYQLAARAGVDVYEANFGCPNTGHQVFSFSTQLLQEVLVALNNMRLELHGPDIWAKLSPDTDPARRKSTFQALKDWTQGLVLTNTLANCRMYKPDGKPAIAAVTPDGQTVNVGGVAGAPLRPISLTAAAEARELLPDIQIVRIGGISRGQDIRESELIGANAVGVATAYMQEGPKVFNRLREELAEL